MYLSLDWLRDYVAIPKNINPEELGLKLTLHTVEVDSVIKEEEKFKNVVVGKILEVKPHPNADRLQLARVDVGNKELSIVCGAPNIEPGQLVPVAMIGAVLPNGLEIKEAEVRGEKSEGMMCAEDELGLGDDHAGIMILEKAKVGQNFAGYLKLEDVIFEIDNKSITNRPDLWGHYGMAREVSAFLKVKKSKKFEDLATAELKSDSQDEKIKLKVFDNDLCPRYMAARIDGVEVKESPKWMQNRLIAVGMRPINSIVDITNYVMLELGQPLHAFDAAKINEIVVRRAKKEEVMETLDGEKRELDDSMLVIADVGKPIAIAGVMGGANSEVEDNTKSLIVESANFDAVSIRKTSQKLGLRTEASVRFEKSLDPNLCQIALARAIELIKEVCPNAKVTGEIIDEKKFELNRGPIRIGYEWAKKVIGVDIKNDELEATLESLGFQVEKIEGEESYLVTVPTWRATKDISIPEDLIEEIARIHGYDNIKPEMPLVKLEAPMLNKERLVERKIVDFLTKGAGLVQVLNYSFVGEEQLMKLSIDQAAYIKLANPIASQHSMLRQNLAVNMLDNIRLNQAKYNEIGIFEIGNVFLNLSGDINKDEKTQEKLPYQEKRLAVILSSKNNVDLFRKTKGVLEYLLQGLSQEEIDILYDRSDVCPSWSNSSVCASIVARDVNIGFVYAVSPLVLKKLGIKHAAVVFEIRLKDVGNILSAMASKEYKELPKYPVLMRDLAFVVDAKVLYNDIKREIEDYNDLIVKVELFDVYEGVKIGANKKSLAFHIIYQDRSRTLTQEEVDEIQNNLVADLQRKYEAQIRDF